MNGDALLIQRGANFGGLRALLRQQVLHAVHAQTFTLGAGKKHIAVTALRLPQPGFQHGARRFGQGCAAFFAALADHAHVSAGLKDQVFALEPGHFG